MGPLWPAGRPARRQMAGTGKHQKKTLIDGALAVSAVSMQVLCTNKAADGSTSLFMWLLRRNFRHCEHSQLFTAVRILIAVVLTKAKADLKRPL